MNIVKSLLVLRGAFLILCAYVIFASLLFLRGDPAGDQSQLIKYGLGVAIITASMIVGTIGAGDILSVDGIINRGKRLEVRIISVLVIFLSLTATPYSLANRTHLAMIVFFLEPLVLYLAAGAFLKTLRTVEADTIEE